MLIRLVPALPDPNILFTVTLADPCDKTPLPANWVAQLHCISLDELEMPSTVHALDKASWLTAILNEITFDLVAMTVSCTFVDGVTAHWPLGQDACVKALQSVLDDVNQSAIEHEHEMWGAQDAAHPEPKAEVAIPDPVPAKPTKHKRQRSLLMSLVACVNRLTSNSSDGHHGSRPSSPSQRPSSPRSSTSSSRAASPKASPPPSLPPSPSPPPRALVQPRTPAPLPPARYGKQKLPSEVLRHRARSTLVDVCRRYVLTGLANTLGPGGYCGWNTRSILRRTEEHMAYLLKESGGAVPDMTRARTPAFPITPTSTSPPPSDDEEGDQTSIADSTSTDTDGSSVHTPLDSPSSSVFSGTTAPPLKATQRVPHSPSPPQFSPEDLAAYTALSGQRLRLRQLLARMDAAQANAANDERAFLAVLEIKSRRRAWSNCAHMGRALVRDVGLATPFRSSPLARYEAITTESLSANLLDVCTKDSHIAQLFPVSEEDEDEEEQAKCAPGHEVDDSLLVLQRPQMRTRTHSMHQLHALDIDLSLAPELPALVVLPAPQIVPPLTPSLCTSSRLPSTALLCQPLKVPVLLAQKTEIKAELFEHPEHAGDGGASPEFTLSMDLPRTRPKLRRYDHEEWIPGGETVRCR